jgi:H/ACA ribonucleoprotein complex subunit 4
MLPSENAKRGILIRKEEETNPSWGFLPEKRPVPELIQNGVINLDKPSGPTSHQVSAWAKEILHVSKAGHGGTLDPAVTGILPVALENATKVVKAFLYSGKEYVALMHLHGDVNELKVREAMENYIGKIVQLPPVRSHVKRVERTREIYYIHFLEKQGRDVLFRVGCQAGTYIRRLCEQIGKELNIGAHMTELRRTKAAGFTEESNLVTLQDISDAYHYYLEEGNEKFLRYCIQPVEHAIKFVSRVWVFDATIESLCHGAKLAVPGISKLETGIKNDDLVAVLSLKGELIGLGTALTTSEEMHTAKNGLAVKMDRIVMKSGTYPKMWQKKDQ